MTDDLTPAHGGQLINREISGDEAAALEKQAGSLPALRLSSRALSDLELIGIGGLSPLEGFMTSDVYKSVVETMRLPNGLAWSLPVTLSATKEEAEAFSELSVTSGLSGASYGSEIKKFTGISDPYEEPVNPELVVETDREGPETSVGRILTMLEGLGYLSSRPKGITFAPIPTYLIHKIEAGLNGRARRAPFAYVAETVSQGLFDGEAIVSPTAEEKASIKERLKELGYLD